MAWYCFGIGENGCRKQAKEAKEFKELNDDGGTTSGGVKRIKGIMSAQSVAGDSSGWVVTERNNKISITQIVVSRRTIY